MSVEFLKSLEKFKNIIEIKPKLPVLQYSVRGEKHGLMSDSESWGICTYHDIIYPYLSYK